MGQAPATAPHHSPEVSQVVLWQFLANPPQVLQLLVLILYAGEEKKSSLEQSQTLVSAHLFWLEGRSWGWLTSKIIVCPLMRL